MPFSVLALDVGSVTATAALRTPDGTIRPVVVDGRDTVSAVLVVAEGQPRPAQPGDPWSLPRLGSVVDRLFGPTRIASVSWSPTELMRSTISQILAAASKQSPTRIGAIVAVAPFACPRRQQDVLHRTISAAAGLPTRLVTSDKALAHTVPIPPSNSASVIVDGGGADLSMCIVGRGSRGPRIITTGSTIEHGGDMLDRLLLASMLDEAGYTDLAVDPRWAFAGVPRVRAAREHLDTNDEHDVPLPRPVRLMTLDPARVDRVAASHFDDAFRALFSTDVPEDAHGIDGHSSRGLVLCGGLAYDPAVSSAAERITGVAPQVPPCPQHAICRGALLYDAADVDTTAEPSLKTREIAGDGDRHRRHRIIAASVAGVAAAGVLVAAGLLVSSALTDVTKITDEDAQDIALNSIPHNPAISGLHPMTWTSNDSLADPKTQLRTGDDRVELSCGTTAPVSGAQATGIATEATRVYSKTGGERAAIPEFDRGNVPNVVVTAAVMDPAAADDVWADIAAKSADCPSTTSQSVRTIIPVPQDGPDPGPPRFAKSQATLTGATKQRAADSDAANGTNGLAMNPDRQAWRGMIPASVSKASTPLIVTCILDRDGIVLHSSCATSDTAAAADKNALAAAAAFNPTPDWVKRVGNE